MTEQVDIDGLSFELRRSSRRRTVCVTVERHGNLIIRAPEELSFSQIQALTRSHLMWVHRKVARKAATLPIHRVPSFVSGESFSFLGRMYPLYVRRAAEIPLSFNGEQFLMREDVRGNGERHFREWYVLAGQQWITERVATLGGRVGEKPAAVVVRALGYRWGSAGRNRVINFNWRLLQLPARLVDYVIAHELTHLRYRQHGQDFWNHLDAAMPDYQERRKALDDSVKTFMVFGIGETQEAV